ncbi:hypothetical protein [Nitrosomonas communis]|uniref:hypothetical protein n=1 Tax=Nitrosomonas communis TaxID=44574 RepID=UPI0026F16E5D|nr:hypothetical protein [Nitrosomonas communis]MCO6426510.1 hypothetical protein [Nitrosomonas communis]
MGFTPFIMAVNYLHDSTDSESDAFSKMAFHSERLEQLNYFHDKADEIKAIIRLYNGNNKQLFKKRVGEFLQQDQGLSLKPQDINASLYLFLNFVFLPFVHFGEVKSLVKEYTQLIMNLPKKPLDDFVENLISSNFLSTLQKDCLKIYPEIYNAEMPIRPALFLDLTKKYEKEKIAARISTKEFQSYKDLYKDIAEVFARQLTIIAGINNIIHRNNSNSFKAIDGGALSSLEKFTSKVLSDKFKYLDDCWYPINKEVVDVGMRNAIAHNNVQYNEISQEIIYYPNGGNLHQTTGSTIYFLDFMRMILVLFREIHNLHHLIKSLFYYEYLIRNRTLTSSSTHQ